MATNTFKDYYADLGLQLGASTDAIKKAFRELAKTHHPDKSGVADADVFRRVREAFEQLTNTEYRTEYDRTYMSNKYQTGAPTEQTNHGSGNENFGGKGPANYKAGRAYEAGRASPPPQKPFRKPYEASWQYYLGKEYTAWQEKDAAYRMRHPEAYESPFEGGPPTPKPGAKAHGMVVQMSHPCGQQTCVYKSTAWRVQVGGEDHCVFCMAAHTGGMRCPGCEALACKACVEKIRALERSPFEGLRSKAQYCSSGG
ncbi:uncharacterized protein J4E79_003159 [Alternaria viburni]|uniref:uncharacterized protein n=1 Tax=Alternaria viburni TaxID=566460 RepID=UPI0020C4E3A2|nr:uncharacterized protein J4E79_003159 [Alternaria viburni]KAI4664861.1 hypothetical protein J4E79_003159 [Alternaria viburni]